MATILIPAPLRTFTGNRAVFETSAPNVKTGLLHLLEAYPALKRQLYTPDGQLRSYVNVFRGETNIRQLQWLYTPLRAADCLSILPAYNGG